MRLGPLITLPNAMEAQTRWSGEERGQSRSPDPPGGSRGPTGGARSKALIKALTQRGLVCTALASSRSGAAPLHLNGIHSDGEVDGRKKKQNSKDQPAQLLPGCAARGKRARLWLTARRLHSWLQPPTVHPWLLRRQKWRWGKSLALVYDRGQRFVTTTKGGKHDRRFRQGGRDGRMDAGWRRRREQKINQGRVKRPRVLEKVNEMHVSRESGVDGQQWPCAHGG